MKIGVAVNLLWCTPGEVGGSEEYLVRQLAGLGELVKAALGLLDLLLGREINRAVEGLVDHVLRARAPEIRAFVHDGYLLEPHLLDDADFTLVDLKKKRKIENSWIASASFLDDSGHQRCTISYPGLGSAEIFNSVEEFYNRFYFRPKFILRSIGRMIVDSGERRKLLREGKQYLAYMKKRRGGQ